MVAADLLGLRVLEGFTVASAAVESAPAPEAEAEAEARAGGGEILIRATLDWLREVFIEHTAIEHAVRLAGAFPEPSRTCPSGDG